MAIFGTHKGKPVELYELKNGKGIEMTVTNYGGIVTSFKMPDKQGRTDDIVLGFNNLENYLRGCPYFGSIIGRCGNRIAGGRFQLEGHEYTLARNDGENSLHGGVIGFDKVLWNARETGNHSNPAVEFTYRSKDGEEGFPGNLDVTVTYTLTAENEFRIEYSALTDKTTIVNLTNHSYWNLAGEGTGDVLDHQIMINADSYIAVNKGLIPRGIEPVAGTPFDFRTPRAIGAEIDRENEQLQRGKGYDHNWVLNKEQPGSLTLAAGVYEKKSGRRMEVFTTEPGVQFYTANYLDGSIRGKGGNPYTSRSAFCLETQHYPDSPNRPDFPTVVLKAGDLYTSSTVYRFQVKE